MLKAIIDYYYFVLIPLFSIAVFYGLQYLTRGIHYFVDEDNNVKWRYLAFMAVMQFFISILITWSVVSAFSSQYLSQYESIKMTAIIIIGSAPFNITILIWVALKLEAYKLMQKRYGDTFKEDDFFYETQNVKEKELGKYDNETKTSHDKMSLSTSDKKLGISNITYPQYDVDASHSQDVSLTLNMTKTNPATQDVSPMSQHDRIRHSEVLAEESNNRG